MTKRDFRGSSDDRDAPSCLEPSLIKRLFLRARESPLRAAAALRVKRVVPQCMLTHIRVVAISDPSFP